MMRMIVEWIRAFLGLQRIRAAASTTLIDRRLQFLGDGELDAALYSRTRDLEIRLRELRIRLQGIVDGDAAARLRSLAVLQQVGEFLELHGAFARAIRNWAPEHPSTESRLRSVVTEGEHLAQEADDVIAFIAEREQARSRLAGMRERFADALPGAWQAIGQPLSDMLSNLRSLSGVRRVREQIAHAQDVLDQRHDALGSLAHELLRRVELSAPEREEIEALHSREEAVARLIELARVQGSDLRTRAIAAVDAQVDHHLRYAGARRTDLAVRGKRLGTPERALARWKQLRRLADTRFRDA